jgi:hypothetical protein
VAPRRRTGRTEEQDHGEYGRKLGLKQNRITFVGRDKVEVARRALDYWYRNPMREGLTLIDFLHRCRISADERKITFHVWD